MKTYNKIENQKIEIIEQPTIEIPNYQYWKSQEQLDAWIALRNLTTWWWWNSFVWNSSKASWTWTQAITGVWFTPTKVIITATTSATAGSTSIWYWDWSVSYCIYWDLMAWWASSFNNNRAIDVNDWTYNFKCSLQSLDSDWFTLNWTTATWWTVYFWYLCL